MFQLRSVGDKCQRSEKELGRLPFVVLKFGHFQGFFYPLSIEKRGSYCNFYL